MKKTLTFFAAALVLAFALTACGSGAQTNPDQPAGSGAAGSETVPGGQTNGAPGVPEDNAAKDGGTVDNNGGTRHDGGLIDDAKDALDDAGDALTDGGNAVRQNFRSASFDQMLRNAQVHDKDGDLKDNENSVTPGAAF